LIGHGRTAFKFRRNASERELTVAAEFEARDGQALKPSPYTPLLPPYSIRLKHFQVWKTLEGLRGQLTCRCLPVVPPMRNPAVFAGGPGRHKFFTGGQACKNLHKIIILYDQDPPRLFRLSLLEQLDQAYQKLKSLASARDDESPQALKLTIPEADAFLQAFTLPALKKAALQDDYYQRHSYADYLHQIYALYLWKVGAAMWRRRRLKLRSVILKQLLTLVQERILALPR